MRSLVIICLLACLVALCSAHGAYSGRRPGGYGKGGSPYGGSGGFGNSGRLVANKGGLDNVGAFSGAGVGGVGGGYGSVRRPGFGGPSVGGGLGSLHGKGHGGSVGGLSAGGHGGGLGGHKGGGGGYGSLSNYNKPRPADGYGK